MIIELIFRTLLQGQDSWANAMTWIDTKDIVANKPRRGVKTYKHADKSWWVWQQDWPGAPIYFGTRAIDTDGGEWSHVTPDFDDVEGDDNMSIYRVDLKDGVRLVRLTKQETGFTDVLVATPMVKRFLAVSVEGWPLRDKERRFSLEKLIASQQ